MHGDPTTFELFLPVSAILAAAVLLIAFVVLLRDKRKAEARHGLYASMLDAAPDAVALVGADYRYRVVNAEYLRRTGRPRSEIVGRAVADVMGEEPFRAVIKPKLDRVLAGETIQYEEWFDYAVQGHRCMLVTYTPYRPAPELGPISGVLVSARDVTEHRRADLALQTRESHLHGMLENSPGIISIKDFDRRYVVLNRRAEALYGFGLGRSVGKTAEELFPPAVANRINMLDQRVLESLQPETAEETIPADGGDVTLLSTRFLLLDGRGNPNALCTISIDMTQRKRLEHDFVVALAKYRTLFNQFPLGITVTDADGGIIETNAIAERILGVSRAEHVARTIDHERWELIRADGSIIPPSEYASVRALRERRVVREDEMGIKKTGGEVTWLSVTASPLPVPGYGVVISYQDISEHKAALEAQRREAALRESERRFRTMADGLASPIWVTDAAGVLQLVNQRFLEFFDVAPGRIAEQGWHPLLHPDDRADFETKLGKALRTGRAFALHHRARRADGEWRWLDSAARPRFSDAGELLGFVGLSNDITRRKRLEMALRRSRQELKSRSEQLARLAAELTRAEQRERRRLGELLHDHLQQLLVGASLAASRVRRRVGEQAEDELARLDALLEEAISASRSLVSDLCPPILFEVGLGESLQWLARSMSQKHGLRVTLDLDHSVRPADDVLNVLLFESAREALFNVVKHADVPEARIRLCRDALRDELRVEIDDTGRGFDLRALADYGLEGGLGLVSMRERMMLLGGRVEIDSVPGSGTRVTLIAPLGPISVGPAASFATLPGAPRPAPARATSDVTVLLVDDHAVMRDGLALMLADEPGIRVVGEAADGSEAMERAAELLPQMIIMDCSMPVMDGVQATRLIHRRWPEIVIIGLSLYEESDRAQAMLDAGASDYVCKTSVANELLAKIRARAKTSAESERRSA